eukprot:gene2642-2943_t
MSVALARVVFSVADIDISLAELAELEAASFESAVPPSAAVRLLQVASLAVALKFFDSSSKRMAWLSKVFSHIAEYVGRDCLDLLACLDLAAAATGSGSLQLKLRGAAPGHSSCSSGVEGKAAGNGTADGSTADGILWPVYVINDVNLLTVLDTVKLILDYSS